MACKYIYICDMVICMCIYIIYVYVYIPLYIPWLVIYIYIYCLHRCVPFFCFINMSYRKSIHSCSPAGSTSTGETQRFQLLLGGLHGYQDIPSGYLT